MDRSKKTIESWMNGYRAKRSGYTMRPTDGALLIETPSTVIPVKRGYDAINAAQRMNPLGSERFERLATTRQAKIETAEEEVTAIEHQLLKKIEDRLHITDPVLKREHALEIGELQHQLAIASTKLQSIITPSRYIMDIDVSKMMLNYESFNDANQSGFTIIYEDWVTLAERSIEKPTAGKTV
jgi:hypothetical protein